jgi:hypothetical protein
MRQRQPERESIRNSTQSLEELVAGCRAHT